MILQACGGSPVIIKNAQFLSPCPVTSSPRFLQLKMSSPEGEYDPIEFKISSTTNRYPFNTYQNLLNFAVTF